MKTIKSILNDRGFYASMFMGAMLALSILGIIIYG